jgi:hypothetical protein
MGAPAEHQKGSRDRKSRGQLSRVPLLAAEKSPIGFEKADHASITGGERGQRVILFSFSARPVLRNEPKTK